MTNRNGARQIVNRRAELNTNETNESEKVIEGYFAVFNSETELFPEHLKKYYLAHLTTH